MKPLIYAKASVTVEQIEVKMHLNADGIELQLLNESLELHDSNRRTWKAFDKVYDLEALWEYPVRAIHAPLVKGCGDITIENMLDLEDNLPLQEMCRLANTFGKRQNKLVTLVVHSESYYNQMMDVGNVYATLRDTIKTLLAYYPYIQIAIENVSPLRNVTQGSLQLSNNFGFDNVYLVERLREDLKTSRVGTILDTCHAMLTDKYITALVKEINEPIEYDFSLDSFFKENKPYIFHIHLCDMKGSGYGRGRHGIPFTEETYDKLKSILDLYRTYSYDCPLCLEVEETDFSVCSGFSQTKELVDRYFDTLDSTVNHK